MRISFKKVLVAVAAHADVKKVIALSRLPENKEILLQATDNPEKLLKDLFGKDVKPRFVSFVVRGGVVMFDYWKGAPSCIIFSRSGIELRFREDSLHTLSDLPKGKKAYGSIGYSLSAFITDCEESLRPYLTV